MIRWLMRLIGIEPAVAPERRRSLIARLTEPGRAQEAVAVRAQRTLERHRKREAAVEQHRAEVEEQQAEAEKQRRKTQSDIHESTISLGQTARRATTRKRRPVKNNPFLASELARKDAERRRQG